ncbi:MAG: RNA polymerase factor sigma-54 [Kiritimatiellia bacterium]
MVRPLFWTRPVPTGEGIGRLVRESRRSVADGNADSRFRQLRVDTQSEVWYHTSELARNLLQMNGVNQQFGMNMRMDQRQVLSHQLQLSLRMLEMTALELNAELRQQIAANPVIDDMVSRIEHPMSAELPEEHTGGAITERELDFTPCGEAAQATLSTDDGYRDYFMNNLQSSSGDEEAQSRRQRMFDLQVKPETLQEHLIAQIHLSEIAPEDRKLAEILIGNIADHGYFTGSIPDIQMVTSASEEKILSVLQSIQKFDPLGCGARTLRECLLAQMEKLDDSPWEDEVYKVIDKHLDDLGAHRESHLCQILDVTPNELAEIKREILSLDPKPGLNPSSGYDFLPRCRENREDYIRPEIFVFKDENGNWTVRVDSRDIPDIRISSRYLKILEDPSSSPEVKSYIREKIRAADALKESLVRRQTTIKNIAEAIVAAQPDFFVQGKDALRPLTMQQIADKTGVHNTTVSRTVKNKYVSTPQGVVCLGDFFTTGVATESGAMVSNVSVQNKLRLLIEQEDKTQPYSDEKLVELLKGQGIVIARRTVSKYRQAMGIKGTNDRRVK